MRCQSRRGAPRALPPLAGAAVLLVLVSLLTVSAGATRLGEARAAEEPAEPGKLLLVLDSSGSMKEPSGDGRTRFQAAVAAMRTVIGSLPADLEVGLRIYGSTIADGPGSCKDSELVVPVQPLDRTALRQALARAKPLGNTPIGYSLKQAAKDLPDEGQRTIVLISDGEESCGGDPCQVARNLSKRGLDLRVDVVGFQVDQQARNQLTCIAQAGRGTFYDAPNAGALVGQLNRLSSRAARAYVPDGLPIEGTPTPAGAPPVEVGQYLDTIGDGDNVESYSVTPTEGNTLYVTATVRPTTIDSADSEQYDLTISAAAGESCSLASEVSYALQDRLTPLSVVTRLSAEELAECGPAPYTIRVERKDGVGVSPLELLVLEEPPVTGTAGLPPQVSGQYDVRQRASGKATRTAGSPSFTSAPTLEPGVYTDSILAGERLFYGVELDWGQQLVCDVTFGPNPALASSDGFAQAIAKVGVYAVTRQPMVGDLLSQAELTYDATTRVTPHNTTVPVRYLNRRSDSAYVAAASMPGTYYCGVLLSEDPSLSSAGETPLTIKLDVVGEPAPGPEYVAPVPEEESPSAAASPTDGQSAAGGTDADGAGGAEDAADDSGGSGPLLWVLVVLAVLAAGVGAFLARRRAGGSTSEG